VSSFSASSAKLSLNSSIHRGPGDVEQLGKFCCGTCASVVYFHQVFLLRVRQLRLLSPQAPFCFRDLHAFACSGANQIRLELGNHGEHVEQKAPDRIIRVGDGSPDAELHVLRRELIDDVFRISEGTRQPVELGNDQRVTATARGKGFPKAWASSVGAGEAVVRVDQSWSNA
jgi:hypothetical protein